jgi:hypothetical protein
MPSTSKRREVQDRNKRGVGLEELLADNMTDKNATGKRIRDDDSVAEEIRQCAIIYDSSAELTLTIK